MPKVFTSKTQKTGELGEDIAIMFLMKHSFEIVERNYTKKWGELDIVAKKANKYYFIEVKSVTCNNFNEINLKFDMFRPEDNMHPWKLKRLSRAIQTYILEKRLDNYDWQFDLLCVFLNPEKRQAKVKLVENIIL